jgi:hypothetical protein
MTKLILQTSLTGHSVYASPANVPGGVAYLGPIALRRAATPLDAIPLAIERAQLMGYSVSPDVELRWFGRR